MTIDNIRESSQVLKEMEDAGEIEIVGGMYDIKNWRSNILLIYETQIYIEHWPSFLGVNVC